MYSPYIALPDPAARTRSSATPSCREVKGDDHYLQFVEAVPRQRQDVGPVQLLRPADGDRCCSAAWRRGSRRPTCKWDAAKLKVTNEEEANEFVRRTYRKGWEVEGL